VTYQQIFKQSTTTGASNGAGYGYPSRSPLVLSEVDVASSFVFCVVFCGPMFIFVFFCVVKKQTYKQWATRYYTENNNINNGPQNTTQKTKI
jgi:hypothetical protein